MERQLPHRLGLGDVADVEAYVRKIVATLPIDTDDEQEEFVADGLELVTRRYMTLLAGGSLERALATWLRRRLLDRWRERHSEWRRNARGATSYLLPAPTGLAWEHDHSGSLEPLAPDVDELAQSRISLEIFQHPDDLGDPRKIGRFYGVPSHKPVSTAARQDLWPLITEERHDSKPQPLPPPFGFQPDVL